MGEEGQSQIVDVICDSDTYGRVDYGKENKAEERQFRLGGKQVYIDVPGKAGAEPYEVKCLFEFTCSDFSLGLHMYVFGQQEETTLTVPGFPILKQIASSPESK